MGKEGQQNDLSDRGKEYRGKSAIEIVRELERDAKDYPYQGGTLWQFLLWSLLKHFLDSLPLSAFGLSRKLNDETLALGYLCLSDECGLGELTDMPQRD